MIKNLSVVKKILCLIALFGVFVIGVAVYTNGQMRALDGLYGNLLSGAVGARNAISRSVNAVLHVEVATLDVVTDPNYPTKMAAAASVPDYVAKANALFDEAAARLPERAAAITALKAKLDDLVSHACKPAIDSGVQATDASGFSLAQMMYNVNCKPGFGALETAVLAESSAIAQEAAAIQAAAGRHAAHTIIVSWIAIIGGLAVMILLAILGSRRWLVRPLNRQIGIMQALTMQNYDVTPESDDRRDEIGAIARALAQFRDAGLEKQRLEQEAAEARAQAEGERNRQLAHQQETTARSTQAVSGIAKGLDHLASGALHYRIEEPFAAEFEPLRREFNETMEKLQETMVTITETTAAVSGASGEITRAADDLSRRTEQQAASLEQTAAALGQITETVRQTSENAEGARDRVERAQKDAARSGAVVDDAVRAMEGIESSSRQIGNILGVIDEIAFQTNLLALNAGVEAARAGEAGRGFAVVATEVRALAQRSADAAREIKALIAASNTEVENGVRAVGATGEALTRIAEQVSHLNELILGIAASAREQASSLAEINTAVNQMDRMTQQNAAMVEETTAASHALAGEAETLAGLIRQFEIEEADQQPACQAARPSSARRAA
ncbi:methyl-accepting chemotaxis protein [Acidisoma sp. 7E03]